MERIELYNLDAVIKNLKGFNYIKQSANIELVALWPVGEDKVRLIDKSLITKVTPIEHGFNRSREFVRSARPNSGCDYYYRIANKPETLELRKKLVNNRTIINVSKDELGYIGTIVEKVEDDVLEYYPNDISKPSQSNVSMQKIKTFYEYNPLYETPSFGDICELVKVDTDANGVPIWKKVPKLIQNEHDSEYADRALNKGVRTVVEIPNKELEKVTKLLTAEGKASGLKEFTTIPSLGDNLFIESDALVINNTINKSL